MAAPKLTLSKIPDQRKPPRRHELSLVVAGRGFNADSVLRKLKIKAKVYRQRKVV